MIAIAILLWGVALVRLARWAISPALSPSLGAVIVLASLAGRLTLFNIPSVSRWVNDLPGWTNLGSLFQLLLLVTANTGGQMVVHGLVHGTQSRRFVKRTLTYSSANALVVVVVFFAAGRQPPQPVYEFALQQATHGWFAVASLVTLTYSAVVCTTVTTTVVSTLRSSIRKWRLPLVFIALGTILFACYSVSRAALIGIVTFGSIPYVASPIFTGGSLTAAAGCVCIVIAVTTEWARTTGRACVRLHRSRVLFAQIGVIAPEMTEQTGRVGGWSAIRRAESRAITMLDFLTLLTTTDPYSSRSQCDRVDDAPGVRAHRIADWLDRRALAHGRLSSYDLVPPVGWNAAEWMDLIIRSRPSNSRAVLLDVLRV